MTDASLNKDFNSNLPSFSAGASATMSSREIADLTGKRHDNVMRDTRATLIELYGEGGLLSFEDTLLNDQNGQAYPIYRLPKRETLILVSGYSVAMRAKIIDRWQELEGRQSFDPSDPRQLLSTLIDYANSNIALQEQVAELAPKAEALDRIATADGSFCITDAAKTLQIQRKVLFAFLRSHRWIYTRAGGGDEIAYQDKLAYGFLEHKTTTVHRSDGSERVTTQVRVTPKGLARLAKELEPVARAA